MAVGEGCSIRPPFTQAIFRSRVNLPDLAECGSGFPAKRFK
jgi:hypothetical protein